jgi:hypothetical protein
MLTNFENFINEAYVTTNKGLVSIIKRRNAISSKWFKIGDHVRFVGTGVAGEIFTITKAYHYPTDKYFNTCIVYELSGTNEYKYAKELEEVPTDEFSASKYNL